MDLNQFKSNFFWNYTKKEIVKCECYSENCIQRNIGIFDFIKGYAVDIKVCNNVLKLMFENVKHQDYLYQDFVEDVVFNYYKENHEFILSTDVRQNDKVFTKQVVSIVTCNRPFSCAGINILDFINLIINNTTMASNRHILLKLTECLEKYFTNNNYKKHTSLKEDVFRQIKKIKNPKNGDIDLNIVGIVNNIFKIIIKNK